LYTHFRGGITNAVARHVSFAQITCYHCKPIIRRFSCLFNRRLFEFLDRLKLCKSWSQSPSYSRHL